MNKVYKLHFQLYNIKQINKEYNYIYITKVGKALKPSLGLHQ